MSLRRIIYTSQASALFNKRDLLDLLHDARAYNAIDNITGLLMHSNGYFLQIIEGDSDAIENLYNRIVLDTRHFNVKLVQDSIIKNRLFSNWSMGCADFDKPELSLIPGIMTDLSNSDVIENLISHLPELASFLLEKID